MRGAIAGTSFVLLGAILVNFCDGAFRFVIRPKLYATFGIVMILIGVVNVLVQGIDAYRVYKAEKKIDSDVG